MKKIQFFIISIILLNSQHIISQEADTSKHTHLNEVIIKETLNSESIGRMPIMKNNVIYAGKKTEVILLDKTAADLSINNARQVFAKVPGMSVWENDGSGIQIGIASRGLSPNRSWEFNIRQNGYDISSEVFGYPETYYTPPLEALSRIEVIRGAASLQFGPQFGGLVNYQIKKGDPNKLFSIESQQTAGSYGLFNSFNAIGGTYKKLSYYSYFHKRTAQGWRDNSYYDIYSGYISVNYQVSKKIGISAEYSKMDYQSQQAGGLTDAQLKENPRQSLRSRNWFSAPYNVASVTLKYDVTDNINIQIKSFYSFAERNSVGFVKSITTKDSINPTTLQYNARQVDRDEYQNFGTEIRTSFKYKLLGKESILAGGIRIYNGNTNRNQLGTGTTGVDFDLTLTKPDYGRSLDFSTINYAAFAENVFQIGNRVKVIPGIRLEYIENTSKGYINTTQAGVLASNKRERQILLYGVGSEFKTSEKTMIYGNYSLAYRPVTFSELTPSATTEIIDPNLKDANGFNADLGFRGTLKDFLSFDLGVFYLNYNNRIGVITQNGLPFKTNIGTSVSQGIESYIELNLTNLLFKNDKYGSFTVFSSNSFIDATYTRWDNPVIANDPLKSIENKRVENAPNFIHRLGASYSLKGLQLSIQYSEVSDVFTDAINTELPNATATIGKIAGYKIMDLTASYKFKEHYNFKFSLNNLTNEIYATRRSTGYPGPGILPGNGRTFSLSLGVNF
ncbi:MAG: TonB-dependent receptor [Fluviicola sp.]|nr:TonB-dependent receptor [Fluviicola sp.]